jgi:anti-anti-sigma factor
MPKIEIVPEHLPISHTAKCTVLHVKGFIDAPNYDAFTGALEKAVKAGDKFVVVDMASVAYINSTGISALIRWQGKLAEAGGALVLAHVPRTVAVSLDLLGLTTVVPLAVDVDGAKDILRGVEDRSLPPGGLGKAAEIKETSRKIPVWPQKPLARGRSSVMLLVPREGDFTEVVKLRVAKARATFHLFHTAEEALKAYAKVAPTVVIVDDRLDPRGAFLARIKLDKGKSLTSVIKLYPKGANVHRQSGFRIWENDYLTDPFELLELFSLAENELRRVPEDREHALQEVRFAFKFNQNRVEKAHRLTFDLLSRSGLALESQDLLFKAFKEALDNAIRHGNKSNPEKQVEVIYLLEKDRVRIQIADEGEGFDYEFYLGWSLMSHALQDAKRKIVKEGKKGGLGILLMRRCTDKIEYRGIGNIVCLEKKIA